MRRLTDHIAPATLQELLDGELQGGALRDAESHLAGCPACAAELERWEAVARELRSLPRVAPPPSLAPRVLASLAEWHRVAEGLERLPHVHPSAEFGRRVMDEFRARRRPAASRVWRWLPSTRRRRALVGAVVAAPTVGILALLGAIVAHPLLTAGDLVTLAGWWASDALAALPGVLARLAATSPFSAEAGSLALSILGSPATAASILGAAWMTTLAAVWVLYRHVLRGTLSSPRSRGHVAR